jgi:phosphatidylglycerophosphate synthase
MMQTVSALVLDDESPVTVGGMTLTERAILLARRAGLDPVATSGTDVAPLKGTANDSALVIIGANVLFEPAVLNELARIGRAGGQTPTAAYESGVPLLLFIPLVAVAEVRTCRSLDATMATLATHGTVRALALQGRFCRRADPAASASSLETAYVRHLNGGADESFFTKQIRRFSVPLTRRLVRVGAPPTQVTFGGLALAVASAWCLARGSYGAGVLGGILYYTSMVFDCSDGEVARLTVRDSAFGAWLETIVDYVTYFLLLAGLNAASQSRPGAETVHVATAIALGASLFVAAVAGYLRQRVAAADPGQFDDASAKALASAGRVHRFARWGRQWIKRSTIAHLVLALALVNQLSLLLYMWAFGATVAAVVILAVGPLVIRRVAVAPTAVH